MRQKHTYLYVKDFTKSLGYILVTDFYNSNSQMLIFKDEEEFYYTSTLRNLQTNKVLSRFYKTNPYTIQNIKLWCKLNNKPFELLDNQEYKGNKEKLKWQCLKLDCGEIFEASWDCIHRGDGCPYCAGVKVCLSNCLATKRPDLVKQWHPTKNGDLTPYDVTYSSGKEVWWQCNKGHEWKSAINNRSINNTGCPYCSGRFPTKENNLLVCNPKLCEEWDYSKNKKRPEEYCPSSNKKIWWVCKKCGYEWKAFIYSRNSNSTGCPKCNESKGEKQLDYILTKYNIPHDSQYTFDDLRGIKNGLLKFDIPIFWDEEKTQLRMLIEYDGIFHYEKIYVGDGFETLKLHDKLKNEYCKNNNIKLLRIPYWEFDNIEEILIRELNINVEVL